MNIEIHQPELEALIQQHMASGAFRNVDELLTKALDALKEPEIQDFSRFTGQKFIEAIAPIRGLLTDEEVDTLFRRDPSPGRVIDC